MHLPTPSPFELEVDRVSKQLCSKCYYSKSITRDVKTFECNSCGGEDWDSVYRFTMCIGCANRAQCCRVCRTNIPTVRPDGCSGECRH